MKKVIGLRPFFMPFSCLCNTSLNLNLVCLLTWLAVLGKLLDNM